MALFVVLVRLGLHLIFVRFTPESVIGNLVEGLLLALWVIAFGALNLLVDFRKLLTKPRQSRLGIFKAGSLALSLIPEYLETIERVKRASTLRGDRKGLKLVRAITVPVLAASIDRALQIATTLNQRGNAGTGSIDGIRLTGGTIGYANDEPTLRDVKLSAAPGDLVLVTGTTGSGKTSFLRLIQAKYPGASYVNQVPKLGFISDTVREELGANLKVAEHLGLAHLLKSDPQTLSAGWQQRLAIAAAIASGSKLLLLDEPFSTLDDSASQELQQLLGKLKTEGFVLVVTEHRSELLAPLASQKFQITKGALIPGLAPRVKLNVLAKRNPEVNVIFGPNGSGKTTYLRKVAKSGSALVPQPACDLLFMPTVREELQLSDQDGNRVAGFSEAIFRRFVPNPNIELNPTELSAGQQLTLAICIQLSKGGGELLLDEPTLGLDQAAKQELLNQLGNLPAEVRVTVATHDYEFADAVNGRLHQMNRGEPIEV